MTYKAFIGIGSNLGSPKENCEKAIDLLHASQGIKVIDRSSLYESEPVGKIEQNWFVNTVVTINTSLTPDELLNIVLKIETTMGRERDEKWGPRIIDLDLLAYENNVINSDTLTIPHPEMTKRRFVLLPLSELAGDYIHPEENKTILDLLKALPETPQVNKIHPTL
ncbi:MAG: 2-amino-4-hydroxy-6-hydroxymethyldihydropteridine diphosphokinase [Nitrospina sp.]|jgi:2-amino-4-hydroxy-6-hydroxymethyldihydropteridine diphosphokinase|nr:2-amino-4-hydroxy-6-hydroxymethyldihydropteridine diphosphokinase [Nitrospina sp.]MBT5633367.1 2-amino-4-hydroxy-6-hydroxymethyldihydropteridine diphosphokinase [Nitrospina sp.]